MRLSDFTPRINGIIPTPAIPRLRGIGDTLVGEPLALAAVSAALQSFLASLPYAVEHGNATPPDQFLAALQYDVNNACTNVLSASEACDPNSATIQAAIQSAYQQYTAAYNSQQQTTYQQVVSGAIVVPASYVPAPNVLNTVAPTQVSVQTGQANGNVLAPPVPVPPVTAQQVANAQTQSGSTAIANGTSGSNAPAQSSGIMDWLTTPISTSIPIPMWAVLAGGAVALLMLKDK